MFARRSLIVDMAMTDIQCVVDAKALLGEGTCWDAEEECLWWLDVYGQKIHRYKPSGEKTQTFSTPAPPGCLAVRERGGLVVAMGDGFHFFDPATKQFKLIVDVETTIRETRMNDGRADRQGRFWSGTEFDVQGKLPRALGSLYRLDVDLCCHKIIGGISCANGLAWSPDSRTMYFTDSGTPYVWAWNFDASSGEIENRRLYIDLSSINGVCDGATVDAEGCYWLTVPFQGKVQQYDPMGKLMRTIDLPTDMPTCCEFGGKNLDVLYVTTATFRRSAEKLRHQPMAGGLFAIDVGVKGLRSQSFKG
jgi:sugar lactone lactonase YvrE